MSGFIEVVKTIWDIHCPGDAAKCISTKLKLLRKGLQKWSTSISMINKLVENCNSIILNLDEIEEMRCLHITEWNFQQIVKDKLADLLKCKQIYWKKRCTAKWAQFGSENTAYFHSMATIRFRHNTIGSLCRPDGSIATEHEDKANLLRQVYKDRLGTTVQIDSNFDFTTFLPRHNDLSELS